MCIMRMRVRTHTQDAHIIKRTANPCAARVSGFCKPGTHLMVNQVRLDYYMFIKKEGTKNKKL